MEFFPYIPLQEKGIFFHMRDYLLMTQPNIKVQ